MGGCGRGRDVFSRGSSQKQKKMSKDAHLADLLRMTESKLLDLQQELESQRQTAVRSREDCASLKRQVILFIKSFLILNSFLK